MISGIFLIFYYVLIFLLGLNIGSFLNSVVYRLEKGNRLNGRSYCPNCKNNLDWLDLIPVFSFLFLHGKCKYCHKKISIQYPLLEISTALIFILVSIFQLPSFEFSIFYIVSSAFLFYVASSLMVIFVYDLRNYIIPDKVLFPAIVTTFLYHLIFNYNFLIINSLWVGLAAFLFFGLIYFVSKGKWMGFGDCKLVILLGFILGFPNILLGLFLSFFSGAIIGLVSILLNKKGLKSQIPFAPFLITGTFIAMFWGDSIINWYRHLFII